MNMTSPSVSIPTGEPYRALCEELRGHLNVDAIRTRERCYIRCYVRNAKYRGAWCVEVGYQWSRPNAHHLRGRVYEQPMGRGASIAAAMIRAAEYAR